MIAPDAAWVLNYRTPLSKLAQAAGGTILPSWCATDVAIAAWTRAFILNDSGAAQRMAPIIAKAHPDWRSGLNFSNPESRFHSAVLISLHHEFQPLVPVDYRTHVNGGDWWCSVSPPTNEPNAPGDGDVSWKLPIRFMPVPAVISEGEHNVASAEIGKLNSAGSAQTFLAPIILGRGKTHPEDPLVPQALHRLVMVVRYGCDRTGQDNGRISKAAFDLLHHRYPKSEWTKKTPYWFK